jgi:tRNA A-37 threonylcarbamoyl transferase component Bud32
MRGSLGEKIGEGAMADVHAWAPGQVVKLLKAGVPHRLNRHEARMIRAVHAAGGPAPEVFDEVVVDGRAGIVLSRYDGPTLQYLSRTGAMTSRDVGAILAHVSMRVHKTPPPPQLFLLRDWMEGTLRHKIGALPESMAPGILALIDRLPPGDGLCHADLHPGNIVMTADGPKLIDWTGAVRAPAALDLACSHILLSELIPAVVPDPERPRAVNEARQDEYARLAGSTHAALTAAMEPYLPVARVFALMGGAARQSERLIRSVEMSLRAMGEGQGQDA